MATPTKIIADTIITGSLTVTDGITGSFKGNGSQITDLQASSIVGYLAQIASGSVTASISPDTGFRVNTNSEITGNLTVDNSIFLKDQIINYGHNILGGPAANGSTYRIVLWDNYNNPTAYRYGLGIEANHLWFGIDTFNPSWGFKWYAVDLEIMKLDGVGNLNISNTLTASNGISGSYIIGDGTYLTNIPASAVVGLNLSQIASGSVTASISPDSGFIVNTNTEITGNLNVTQNITASYFTGSFIGNGSGLFNIPSGAVDLSAYATLLGVSSSFVDNNELTGAIIHFPTRNEVTGVLINYPTLINLSASFVDNNELTSSIANFSTRAEVSGAITGALIPYALSTDVSASFVDNNELTAAIANFPTRTEVTGVLTNYSTLAGNNTFTGINTFNNSLTGTNAFFSGDIKINGTASIAMLETINEQSLVVGDKYIVIMSGGVDHIGLDGAGLLWGTGSTGPTVDENGANAYVKYRSSFDKLEIFPGLRVSGSITSSNGISSSAGFIGDGSQLINIPATAVVGLNLSQIASGSVTASVNPTNGFQVNTNTFITGNLNVTQNVTASSFSGSFYGDGANLSNIPASSVVGLNLSQIASGSVTASVNPTIGFSVNSNSFITGNLNVTQDVTASAFSGAFIGDGSSLINIPASSVLGLNLSQIASGSVTASANPAVGFVVNSNSFITGNLVVTQDVTASAFTGSFYGNGANLTNVPASAVIGLNLSQIASGSVTASISPITGFQVNTDTSITGNLNVSQDITASYFTGSFKGDGAGLYNIPSGAVDLSGYPTLIALSASFVENNELTGAIADFPTRTEVTGVLTNYPTLAGNNTFTGINTFNNSLTGTNAYFSGDVKINGTASIALLETLSQSSLQIGDKYIVILTGASDHTTLDGSGILWGSGSTGPTVDENGANAYVRYRNTYDKLEIFPGLRVSGSITSSNGISSSAGFVGDGSQLINIPATAVVGLNLSQIADGAVTASVNSATGFSVNSNSTITGNLNVTSAVTASEAKIGSSTGAVIATNGVLSTVSPSVSGNVLTSNGTQWVSSPSAAASSVNVVTASVDFNFISGNEGNYAVTYVSASWATSNTKFFCSPSVVGTADHDPVDATLEDLAFSVLNVTGGVGFNLVAYAPRGTWGTYLVNILGV